MELKIGDKVRIAGTDNIGIIKKGPNRINEKDYYEVYINDSNEGTYESVQLEPAEQKSIVQLIAGGNYADATTLKKWLLITKIRKPLHENLFSFMSSRTIFQVHQIRPLLKFLQSPKQRLLIADEVGLGKTIEASMIISELESRMELQSILIVCPKSLLFKWQQELKKRFNLNFEIIASRRLSFLIQEYGRTGSMPVRGITSLQGIRRPEILEMLEKENPPFDLVVIDEAHHLRNRGTNSFRLGQFFSRNSNALIFLTATPLNLGKLDFFNLIHLLAPDEFPTMDVFEEVTQPNGAINKLTQLIRNKDLDIEVARKLIESLAQEVSFDDDVSREYIEDCIKLLQKSNLTRKDRVMLQMNLYNLNTLASIFTRTKKKDVGEYAVRVPATVRVTLNPAEREIFEKAVEFSIMLSSSPSKNGFLRVMLERQAASCIPATLDYVRDAIKNKKIELELDDSEDIWDNLDDGESEISLHKKELALLEDMEGKFTASVLKEDQKFIEFKSALRQAVVNGSKKIIVFSYFKRTLRYLKSRIAHDIPEVKGVEIISGDVDVQERNEIIKRFWASEGTYVLLSSEVGGEGLDLQVSNCLFNYDLPWNPMVVEQRIGRVDRFGQKSDKIHIYNFVIRDTVEDKILFRLYDRIGLFETSIGELEPLLGQDVEKLTSDCFNSKLTAEEADARMENVLVAIEKRKKELELLDTQREEIIGLDEYFTEQVNSIRKNRRFVSHEEIEFFIQTYISHSFPQSKVELRGNKVWNLTPDKKLRKRVYDFIMECRFGSAEPEARRFSALIESNDRISITFDPQVATTNPSLEFVTLRHAMVLLAVKDVGESLGREQAFSIKIGKKGFFFIYLIEVGQRIMSPYLEAVFVSNGKAETCEEITKLDFDKSERISTPAASAITAAKRLADEFIAIRQKAIYDAQLSECSKFAAIKKRNIRAALELTIKKLESRVKEAKDERLKRMLSTMIEKRKSELNGKLAIIEEETHITIRHRIIAGGVAE